METLIRHYLTSAQFLLPEDTRGGAFFFCLWDVLYVKNRLFPVRLMKEKAWIKLSGYSMCPVAMNFKKNPEISKHTVAPPGASCSPTFLDLAVLRSTARSKEKQEKTHSG